MGYIYIYRWMPGLRVCGMRRFWAGRGDQSEGGDIKHIKKRVEVPCVKQAHLVGKRGVCAE